MKTKQGHEYLEVIINYGSKGNSVKAGRIAVTWNKDAEEPEVHFQKYIGAE